MTVWERPPLVEPRDRASLPITRAERRAARAGDEPTGWHLYEEENRRVRTRWRGYDLSSFALHGGIEDPNETAAVPSETVMESIEVESNPLVALRNMAMDNQAIIRSELDIRIQLEDLVQTRGLTIDRLRTERNQLREVVNEVIRERDSAEAREDALQRGQNGVEFRREQFERERDHYQNDRDWYRDENRLLQADVRNLTAQLTAARALLANQPPVAQPPVNAAPVVQPPVVQPPVAVDPAGAVRGARRGRASGGARGTARGGARGGPRGRAGRGARGGAPARREQPGRSCKVEKNYRQ